MDPMNLEPWNPWREIEEVERQVERLFKQTFEKLRHSLPGRELAFVPVTDILETGEEYIVCLSLPGVLEEDIDITVEGNVLIVRGEREPPFDPRQVERGEITAHLRQWKYGYFERRLQVPEKLSTEGVGRAVHATLDAGVLTVRIRKSSS